MSEVVKRVRKSREHQRPIYSAKERANSKALRQNVIGVFSQPFRWLEERSSNEVRRNKGHLTEGPDGHCKHGSSSEQDGKALEDLKRTSDTM